MTASTPEREKAPMPLPTETPQAETNMTVIDEIAAERKRQIEVEGWHKDHDDLHDGGDLATAAACYALGSHSVNGSMPHMGRRLPISIKLWSWDMTWWKPTNRRRDLIKAGALIVAEIERLDQAEKVKP